MTFTDAVRDGLTKYAVFAGRASRPQYWYFTLFVFVVYLAADIVDALAGTDAFSGLAFLGLIIPTLSVTARRLHDSGNSGWLQLLFLIPVAGILLCLVFMLRPSVPAGGKTRRAAEAALGELLRTPAGRLRFVQAWDQSIPKAAAQARDAQAPGLDRVGDMMRRHVPLVAARLEVPEWIAEYWCLDPDMGPDLQALRAEFSLPEPVMPDLF